MLYLKRFFFNAATVNIKQSLVKDATNVETANGCSKVQDWNPILLVLQH